MNKINKTITVWEDKDLRRYVYIILALFLIFIFLYNAFDSLNTTKFSSDIIFALIIFILSLYFIIINLKTRLTSINSKGIQIGNAPDDKYQRIIKTNPKFLEWKQIKEIRLEQKPVTRPFFYVMKSFVIVATKDGKEYESYISKPEEFKYVLEKLNKSLLMDK